MSGKPWTAQEDEYLREHWGTTSIPAIAEALGKSRNAVLCRKGKLRLGAFLDNHPNGAVSVNALLKIVGKDSYSYTQTSWIKNRGLPVFYKKVGKCKFRMISIDKFWKWAENNQDFLDFSDFEPLSLGAEPEWVQAKRSRDRLLRCTINKMPWTRNEDEKLAKYLKDHKYTVDEISKLLQRTNGAVQRRISTLGLKERPIKAYNHNKYSDEQLSTIKEMIVRGCNYSEISSKIGRSEKAIRGTVYRYYKTERLDKARQIAINERNEDNG